MNGQKPKRAERQQSGVFALNALAMLKQRSDYAQIRDARCINTGLAADLKAFNPPISGVRLAQNGRTQKMSSI